MLDVDVESKAPKLCLKFKFPIKGRAISVRALPIASSHSYMPYTTSTFCITHCPKCYVSRARMGLYPQSSASLKFVALALTKNRNTNIVSSGCMLWTISASDSSWQHFYFLEPFCPSIACFLSMMRQYNTHMQNMNEFPPQFSTSTQSRYHLE